MPPYSVHAAGRWSGAASSLQTPRRSGRQCVPCAARCLPAHGACSPGPSEPYGGQRTEWRPCIQCPCNVHACVSEHGRVPAGVHKHAACMSRMAVNLQTPGCLQQCIAYAGVLYLFSSPWVPCARHTHAWRPFRCLFFRSRQVHGGCGPG